MSVLNLLPCLSPACPAGVRHVDHLVAGVFGADCLAYCPGGGCRRAVLTSDASGRRSGFVITRRYRRCLIRRPGQRAVYRQVGVSMVAALRRPSVAGSGAGSKVARPHLVVSRLGVHLGGRKARFNNYVGASAAGLFGAQGVALAAVANAAIVPTVNILCGAGAGPLRPRRRRLRVVTPGNCAAWPIRRWWPANL